MKLLKREKYLKKIRPFYHSDIIKIITGIRRCGKSCILEMIRDELSKDGVDETHIIFLPLDKKNYKSIKSPEALEKRIEEYIIDDGFYYLFVDEVQNVPGFESVIETYCAEQNFSIFLTGSNSYLLSDEISTKLTGRYIEFEIFTLDFSEYEAMKKLKGLPISPYAEEELEEYLTYGGFPKSLEFPKDARQRYTTSLIGEIFKKDIQTRNKIRSKAVFERLQAFIIGNYGSTFSLNSVYDYLRNNEKINITKQTLERYIDILQKAKIIYKCPRFDQKSKRILKGEYKFYLADSSLYFSSNVDNRINYGPALENLVFLHLLSNDYSVCVGKIKKFECDFISRDSANNYAYIQVTKTLSSPDTEDREYRPFTQIRDGYPRYILSLDRLRNQRDGIKHESIIDLLLGKKEI